MQHRHLEWFDNVRGVLKTAVIFRLRSEAYLVVRDDVDGAAAAEVWELAHCQCLIRCSLTWECGVTMRLDVKHYFIIFISAKIIHFGLCLAH